MTPWLKMLSSLVGTIQRLIEGECAAAVRDAALACAVARAAYGKRGEQRRAAEGRGGIFIRRVAPGATA
jgi:hypothetical protein